MMRMGVITYKTRAEAFDHMFTTLCEQGMDIMEAAKKADEFAEIVAKNRALPAAPKNAIGKCVDVLKEVSQVKKEYPEAWEIVGGILSGVVGLIAGTKVAESADDTPATPLDFDNLE